MKISIGQTVWMIDGTYLSIIRVTRKYVIVEDGRKVLTKDLNQQHGSGLLLELQDGIKEFV